MGDFNSTNDFDCWIGSGIASFGYQLWIKKIVISSFSIGIEMQILREVKVKILYLSKQSNSIFLFVLVVKPKMVPIL
jgi:hypothetical protein